MRSYMGPRHWLGLAVVVILSLWLSGDVDATQVSIEGGKGSGTVCEGNVTYFWNVTVTNDDSVSSEYDLTNTATDLVIDSGTANLELNFGESGVARFRGHATQGSSPGNIDVYIFISSSNGGDAQREWRVNIERCTNLSLEAQTSLVRGEPRDNLTLPFRLTDMGNYNDEINLSLDGLPVGWQAYFQRNLTMRGGESLNLTLFLVPGSSGSAILRLTATAPAPGINLTIVEIKVKIEEEQSFVDKYRNLLVAGALGIMAVAGVTVYLKRE